MLSIKRLIVKVLSLLLSLSTSKLDAGELIQIVSAPSSTISVNANKGFYVDTPITVPTGYVLIGCVGFTSTHNQACNTGSAYKYTSTSIRVSGMNNSSSNWTDLKFTVHALCVRSDIVA